jgi:hypothetical protein
MSHFKNYNLNMLAAFYSSEKPLHLAQFPSRCLGYIYPRIPAGPKSRTLLAHEPEFDIGSPLSARYFNLYLNNN